MHHTYMVILIRRVITIEHNRLGLEMSVMENKVLAELEIPPAM